MSAAEVPQRPGAEQWVPPEADTSHPSAALRLRGREGLDEAFAALVADLRVAAGAVSGAD